MRGRGELFGTPARGTGVCSPSEGRGKAWTSRSPRCVAPGSSRTPSALSSEPGACHVAVPANGEEEGGGHILRQILRRF